MGIPLCGQFFCIPICYSVLFLQNCFDLFVLPSLFFVSFFCFCASVCLFVCVCVHGALCVLSVLTLAFSCNSLFVPMRRVGHVDAVAQQDIQLSGSHILENHCTFRCSDTDVALVPSGDALCYVNGRQVTDPVVMRTGSRVILGKHHVFRFNHPQQGSFHGTAFLCGHVMLFCYGLGGVENGPYGCDVPGVVDLFSHVYYELSSELLSQVSHWSYHCSWWKGEHAQCVKIRFQLSFPLAVMCCVDATRLAGWGV